MLLREATVTVSQHDCSFWCNHLTAEPFLKQQLFSELLVNVQCRAAWPLHPGAFLSVAHVFRGGWRIRINQRPWISPKGGEGVCMSEKEEQGHCKTKKYWLKSQTGDLMLGGKHTMQYTSDVFIELCTWNLYNFVYKCYHNKFNLKSRKRDREKRFTWVREINKN